MAEFGGLGTQQNNPACTERVRVFIMLKVNTIRKKKKTSIIIVVVVVVIAKGER